MDNLEQQTTYDMKQRLELTWIGKGEEDVLEPRILIENPEYSYGDPDTGNLLIHGDNLLALRSLVASGYAGKVKCIYIDPPYNTGNAFDKYDDNVEHSIWLNLMYQRFQLLYALLKEDGFLFVNLDEQEHAYCKVLLDEIFQRKNFIGDLIWQKRKGGGNDSTFIALDHDYILVYAKNASKEIHSKKWVEAQTEEYLKRFKEIDEQGNRYYWDTVSRNGLQNPIIVSVNCPDGSVLTINSQKSQASIEQGLKDGNIRLTKSKTGWSLHHRVYMGEGKRPRSVITEVGTNKTAADEMLELFGSKKSFPYPKPENLIQKIFNLATSPGDLVLDSFLGSGTTAAVAHKMGRRYIGIELGDHAYTHCVPRLKKVIDGTDQGGITASTGWAGGGGFRFCELAPTLLNEDEHGVMVISPEYNAEMLAAAMALHEGFRYAPDAEVFWKQGHSTESDYIYTTTQHLTIETLQYIDSLLGEGETLLICCTSHGAGLGSRFPRITVKRIPRMLLGRCAFDPAKSYDLNIITLPEVEPQDEDDDE
ncbi:site-specific DNA-methyltransferase [Porphyromonas gingivalis]|uniref:site-specific DNA-methyltransferase n=1 Tax=Porphyromonas gingivalis TaxID=837 RepID=UPI000974F65D|nr:site-specific DNA-methyltransferase [Porphyromonas gingivalis]SJL22699.1 Modification methylase MboII [Porphyromonas gingivalis]